MKIPNPNTLLKTGLTGMLAMASALGSCDTLYVTPPQPGQLFVYDHCKDEAISHAWLENANPLRNVAGLRLSPEGNVTLGYLGLMNAQFSPEDVIKEGAYLIRVNDAFGKTLFAERADLTEEQKQIPWPSMHQQTFLEVSNNQCDVLLRVDVRGYNKLY